jgi:hypothetical protein
VNFEVQVRNRTEKCFNVSQSLYQRLCDSSLVKNHVPIYAAFLYDSVMLYARALATLIHERRNETTKNLANNGGLIANRIKTSIYSTIMGTSISFDKSGASEGSFTAYAVMPQNFYEEYYDIKCNKFTLHCDHYLEKVRYKKIAYLILYLNEILYTFGD